MSLQSAFSNYTEAVRAIKDAILQSRYRAARSINREALSLDYYIGKYISEHSRGQWGTGALAIIAKQLQQELPGLRGFSEGNMRKMRIFYDEWKNVFEDNRALPTHEIRPLTTDESRNLQLLTDNEQLKIRTLSTHELTEEQLQHFLSVPFTHHYEIIKKTTSLQERLYYILYRAGCQRVLVGRETAIQSPRGPVPQAGIYAEQLRPHYHAGGAATPCLAGVPQRIPVGFPYHRRPRCV